MQRRRAGGAWTGVVRRQDGSLELRVDGQLASVWGRGAALTDPVWYALAAPLVALPPPRRRSLLVLGLGAGSAGRVLRALAPHAHIVGVEWDARVVRLARRHFALDALGIEVVTADAAAYLAATRRRFDFIVEDLFVGPTRSIRKPVGWPAPGLARCLRRLRPGGILAVNTIHEGPLVARTLRRLASTAGRPESHTLTSVGVRGYYNRILALGPATLSARRLRRDLERLGVFSQQSSHLELRDIK